MTGYSGCVKLTDIGRGELEIKVWCQRYAPLQTLKEVEDCEKAQKKLQQQMLVYDNQYENIEKEKKRLEQELPAIRINCNKLQNEVDRLESEKMKIINEGICA